MPRHDLDLQLLCLLVTYAVGSSIYSWFHQQMFLEHLLWAYHLEQHRTSGHKERRYEKCLIHDLCSTEVTVIIIIMMMVTILLIVSYILRISLQNKKSHWYILFYPSEILMAKNSDKNAKEVASLSKHSIVWLYRNLCGPLLKVIRDSGIQNLAPCCFSSVLSL